MYDCEYEGDVLLVLRLLKYLHMHDPDMVKRVIELYKELDPDEMCVMIEEILWSIFDDVLFDSDEFDETAIVYFSHPDIDRLYKLGTRCVDKHGSLSNAWRRKIQDIAEYYVLGASNSVYEFGHHFSANGVVFEVRLSPDCYEPELFGNSLIDMLLHVQQELRRLEKKVAEEDETKEWEEAA